MKESRPPQAASRSWSVCCDCLLIVGRKTGICIEDLLDIGETLRGVSIAATSRGVCGKAFVLVVAMLAEISGCPARPEFPYPMCLGDEPMFSNMDSCAVIAQCSDGVVSSYG
eukprot:6211501-Pleurochrysis_carterae.AAC.1